MSPAFLARYLPGDLRGQAKSWGDNVECGDSWWVSESGPGYEHDNTTIWGLADIERRPNAW